MSTYVSLFLLTFFLTLSSFFLHVENTFLQGGWVGSTMKSKTKLLSAAIQQGKWQEDVWQWNKKTSWVSGGVQCGICDNSGLILYYIFFWE